MELAPTTLLHKLIAFQRGKGIVTRTGQFEQKREYFRAFHAGNDVTLRAMDPGAPNEYGGMSRSVASFTKSSVGPQPPDSEAAAEPQPPPGLRTGRAGAASSAAKATLDHILTDGCDRSSQIAVVHGQGAALPGVPASELGDTSSGRTASTSGARSGGDSVGRSLPAIGSSVTNIGLHGHGERPPARQPWQQLSTQGFDPAYIVNILVDVASGLRRLHESGSIVGPTRAFHGDVRPGNVLLWPSEAGTIAKLTPLNFSTELRMCGAESVTEPAAWRCVRCVAVSGEFSAPCSHSIRRYMGPELASLYTQPRSAQEEEAQATPFDQVDMQANDVCVASRRARGLVSLWNVCNPACGGVQLRFWRVVGLPRNRAAAPRRLPETVAPCIQARRSQRGHRLCGAGRHLPQMCA